MTEPTKIITFGGARFDENRVAFTTTAKKNDKTYYVVNFKTGAKVEYPAQAKGNNASIYIGRGEGKNYVGCCSDGKKMEQMYDNMIDGKPGYEDFIGGEGVVMQKADQYIISQFYGIKFTGTQKPDNVNLKGCNRCTVDVRGGNSYAGDEVTLGRSPKFVSQHNEVLMDAKDRTNEQKGNITTNSVIGAGTHHEGDSRDKLK